jgi:hypothetical protein
MKIAMRDLYIPDSEYENIGYTEDDKIIDEKFNKYIEKMKEFNREIVSLKKLNVNDVKNAIVNKRDDDIKELNAHYQYKRDAILDSMEIERHGYTADDVNKMLQQNQEEWDKAIHDCRIKCSSTFMGIIPSQWKKLKEDIRNETLHMTGILRFVRGREKYNQNGLSGLSNRIAVKMNKI